MLRVIAGEARGRRLRAPEGEATRPMLDRQKQAVFDILAPLFPCDLVFDVFAGSGSLGIESLSRGAARAVFVEQGRHALPVLRTNLETCGYQDRSTILAADAFALDTARFGGAADLVFLDPPFPLWDSAPDRVAALICGLRAGDALGPQATLVLRTPSAGPPLPPGLAGECRDSRLFGESRVHFLKSAS